MKFLPLLISSQFILLSLPLTAHAQSTSADQSSTSSSTGANKGDDQSDSITPFSQSNAQEDLNVTRSIRQAIEKQDGLSQNAKNIKIITTTNHMVYLKGVVDSEDERNRVLALAKPIIGDHKFMSLLKLPSETHTSNTQ